MKEKIFIYRKEDEKVEVYEVTDDYSFTDKGLVKVGNLITNRFFKANNQTKFEEELYDLASQYAEHWEVESFYDDIYHFSDLLGRSSSASIVLLDQ